MKIELHSISVKEIIQGYKDNGENGVVAYNGLLDVRPPYQREFVYKDEQRNAVIDTVMKGFPLNIMYWVQRDDGTYEVLDGQQRTLSICQYVAGVFSYKNLYYHNLADDIAERFLNYKLMIYFCCGEPSERLEWFKTVNIAGEELTTQELRNATFPGPWLTDAKRYFSRVSGPAYQIGKSYLTGAANRQDYLQTAIKWISDDHIEDYMGVHQHDTDATELWTFYQQVINWIKTVFPKVRSEMKSVDWISLYKEFHDKQLDPVSLEVEIARLFADSDVTNKKGVYTYVLTQKESALNIRAFDNNTKLSVYAKQNGICPLCHKHFEIDKMEADHITPWCEGGRTNEQNCQMLCKECNRRKSNK